jgi:CRISPR/Cas system endoribonuclease Cas6 (RAMP superfamily)
LLNAQVIYNREEDLFRPPAPTTLADWIRPRVLQWTDAGPRFTISFLTPTYLKFMEQPVLRPDFHHLFKRVRDRLNAVCTFFGPGPIDADFKGLGERAEQVRTVKANVRWLERSRRSSKTGHRHELSGFVGSCTYEFPPDESETCNLELLRWIICGEPLHAGRHTAWGNGYYKALYGGAA